jgi:hypothetical protein
MGMLNIYLFWEIIKISRKRTGNNVFLQQYMFRIDISEAIDEAIQKFLIYSEFYYMW